MAEFCDRVDGVRKTAISFCKVNREVHAAQQRPEIMHHRRSRERAFMDWILDPARQPDDSSARSSTFTVCKWLIAADSAAAYRICRAYRDY